MAFGCLTLALLMAGGLVWRSAQSIVTPYVIEVDNAGQVRAVGEAATPYQPGDAQMAHHLGALCHAGALAVHRPHRRAAELAGCLRLHHRQGRGGAQRLRAGTNDPFARIGKESVTVQITSVVRASDTSFNVRWTERALSTARWRAPSAGTPWCPSSCKPRAPKQRLRKNPLGIYVNGLSWSRELDSSEGAKAMMPVFP
jgi:type IV secretory pathway TrbF-like protein